MKSKTIINNKIKIKKRKIYYLLAFVFNNFEHILKGCINLVYLSLSPFSNLANVLGLLCNVYRLLRHFIVIDAFHCNFLMLFNGNK